MRIWIITTLLTFLIIEPALPYEENATAFIYRILNQPRFTPMNPNRIIYYPENEREEDYRPKGKIKCIYENEYCNDFPESQQVYEMDFPSISNELEIIICDGENENFSCQKYKAEADYSYDNCE